MSVGVMSEVKQLLKLPVNEEGFKWEGVRGRGSSEGIIDSKASIICNQT